MHSPRRAAKRYVPKISGSIIGKIIRLGNQSILKYQHWGNRRGRGRVSCNPKQQWAKSEVQEILSRLLAKKKKDLCFLSSIM